MTEVSRSAASLRFFGDDLLPEEVTARVGTAPTASEIKGGQSQPNSGGRTFTARTGGWRLKVADRVPGDLDGQIWELLGRLTTDLKVWRELTVRFRVDVFCGLWLNEGNEGISLAPTTLEALGQRGILLDLDIYKNEN